MVYRKWEDRREVSDLVGLTLSAVDRIGSEEIRFTVDDGRVYTMFHDQDCCESVEIDDIVGDLSDLVGSPVLIAEERNSPDTPRINPECPGWTDDSFTWTFYEIATNKGSVTIKWCGSSNGYYSESVDFYIEQKQ